MAGILVQALMANIDDERQLTSLSVSFTAPTDGDQAFDIHMDMIREGKNVSQTVAYCQQNGVIGTNLEHGIMLCNTNHLRLCIRHCQ